MYAVCLDCTQYLHFTISYNYKSTYKWLLCDTAYDGMAVNESILLKESKYFIT